MNRGGNECGNTGESGGQFLQQLASEVNLVAGKICISLHENSVSAVKVKASFKVTFDSNGRPSTRSRTANLCLAAAERVQDAEFLGQLRAAVGQFGCCIARVERGRLAHWEFRRRLKPSR